MSEPPPPPVPEPPRLAVRILRLCIYGLLGFVLLGVFTGELVLLFDFVFTLLFGWWKYLAHVVPRMRFNVEIALCSAVALALATIGLHRILRRWRSARGDGERWRAGWTIRITAMLLLQFATSIAATGIVHQVGWLFRAEGLTYNAGVGLITNALSNVKQTMLGIRMYSGDQEEIFPKTLEELMPKYCTSSRIFFVHLDRNEPPERVLYFPGYKGTDPQDTIVVASPRPLNGQRVIGFNDGSARPMDESEFQTRMQKQFGGKFTPAAARALQAR